MRSSLSSSLLTLLLQSGRDSKPMLDCATGAGMRSLLATFVVKGQAERSDIFGGYLLPTNCKLHTALGTRSRSQIDQSSSSYLFDTKATQTSGLQVRLTLPEGPTTGAPSVDSRIEIVMPPAASGRRHVNIFLPPGSSTEPRLDVVLTSDIAAAQAAAASAAAMPSEDLLAPRVPLVLPPEQRQDNVNIFLSLQPQTSLAPPSVAALPPAPSQPLAPDSPTQVEARLLPCDDEERVESSRRRRRWRGSSRRGRQRGATRP